MAIEDKVRAVSERVSNSAVLGGSIRINLKEGGQIVINSDGVTGEDISADCTVTMANDTFEKMLAGQQSPTAAFMTGKLKITGNMAIATKLGTALTGKN